MSITIDGTTYTQQYRKCGKATCACAYGKGHGPYWYARDLTTGKRRYIGKQLPAHVHQAIKNLRRDRDRIRATRDLLLRQSQALTRLLSCRDHISTEDARIITALGFLDCLVPATGPHTLQERIEP